MSVNLNNIKEQIQGIFEAANTTTAANDLSSGLQTRVKKIAKLNPTRIPLQSSWYPFVTCYVSGKTMPQQDIALTQVSGKRRGEIEIKIVGAVWNSIYTNKDVDEADDDCESLMENIEEILRNNSTLVGTVTWSLPESVTYHSTNVDEGCNIRAGILTLKARIFY